MSDAPRERSLELDRVVNFSDGVFAISATVLVLSISVPSSLKGPGLDNKVWGAFQDALPQIFAYALSFFIIGRTWLAHHRMFKIVRRLDGRFIALNLVVLGLVALLPFPTEVYGEYTSARPALIVYAAAISASGLASVALWWYATHDNRLIDPSTPREWMAHAHLRGLTLPAVFLTSIPVSFISIGAAQAWPLLLIPLRSALVRRYGKITEIW
jgi:TMEM175 potassium channel family protein